MSSKWAKLPGGVMFNAYPDSCGGSLEAAVSLLKTEDDLRNTFSLFYVLPSLFNSDLDRGFSIVDYGINEEIASRESLDDLQSLGIQLKLDFVLNHISVQSPQFRDVLAKGDASEFADFFIDWNRFWDGNGAVGSDGYVVPDAASLDRLFMRKPELPLLRIPFPDGTHRFFWNTFYQDIKVAPPTAEDLQAIEGLTTDDATAVAEMVGKAVAESQGSMPVLDLGEYDRFKEPVLRHIERDCVQYLGQMDLNARSEKVWDYYDKTIGQLAGYGAVIVRLDAFAYLHKEVGETNFFNEPGTWDYLDRLKELADRHGVLLLPEIHSRFEEKIHEKLSDHGFAFYDFFFPGLVIHALETGDSTHLVKWIREVDRKGFTTVNMLGCHDGIPLLDIKGLLPDESIDGVIEAILDRGGRVKNLYGADGTKISYYQVNATFFSALDANEKKLLLARAIQMFMPGIPEVWYLDLFAGENDLEAADLGGHKEINRTNLSLQDIRSRLSTPIVQEQLKLIRFRNTFPAFGFGSKLTVDDTDKNTLMLEWAQDGSKASLRANLSTFEYEITQELGMAGESNGHPSD